MELTDKEIASIIEDADCDAFTHFRSSQGEYHLLGWARRLINAAFQVGVEANAGPEAVIPFREHGPEPASPLPARV